MSKPDAPEWLSGGCHCGAVRFRVRARQQVALDCNCSICRKKGFLHLIIEPEDFVIERGEDALASYRFNTRVAEHRFCKTCGIHPFYTPRSHPDKIDVNLRCIDAPPNRVRIERFDGKNWEDNVEAIRGARR
jgi:hypothetical protein